MTRHVLEFVGVSKVYGSRRSGIRVLRDLNVSVAAGETLGIVGESGSGKSTLARLALGMEQPTTGVVRVDGKSTGRAGAGVGGSAQIVFQDPASSLNPVLEVVTSVREPLTVSRKFDKAGRTRRADTILDEVRLNDELRHRIPGELSGGQKQRASIARALAALPPLVVCDEAVTALDVSVRAQVLNLLRRVREEYNSTLLFISHDLSTVAYMSDRILVLYLGKVMEIGTTASLLRDPAHPYTMTLLSAVPRMQQGRLRRERIVLGGEAPSIANPPAGCPFSTRCPIAQDLCRQQEPPLAPLANGNSAACHFPHVLGADGRQGAVA